MTGAKANVKAEDVHVCMFKFLHITKFENFYFSYAILILIILANVSFCYRNKLVIFSF